MTKKNCEPYSKYSEQFFDRMTSADEDAVRCEIVKLLVNGASTTLVNHINLIFQTRVQFPSSPPDFLFGKIFSNHISSSRMIISYSLNILGLSYKIFVYRFRRPFKAVDKIS